MRAKGTFEVNLQPLDSFAEGKDGINLGRMSIEKTFHGDLEGTSQGEMLSVLTGVEGSAGYVAVEQVSGTLGGRNGRFVLQHFGLTHQGENRLVLEVVPGSGSGQLSGLSGTMDIRIAEGKHFYDFLYSLPLPEQDDG